MSRWVSCSGCIGACHSMLHAANVVPVCLLQLPHHTLLLQEHQVEESYGRLMNCPVSSTWYLGS